MLKQKIQQTQTLITQKLTQHYQPAIGCSFGIDSQIVLHMCLQIKPDILVVWCNTLVEYPDTVKFAKFLTQKWNLNLIEARPKLTFWQIIERYGFPLLRRGHDIDHGKLLPETHAAQQCCKILKKKPMEQTIKKYNIDLAIDGLRADESRLRKFNAQKFGPYHFHKTWGLYKLHPIQAWTKQDCWDYINQFHLPYNPLYDKKLNSYQPRTGCWCCTLKLVYSQGQGMQHLRTFYPALWKALMLKHGLAKEIIKRQTQDNPINLTNDFIQNWLTNRPCLFDHLEIH